MTAGERIQLVGTVAVVTGAAQGIGAATAVALARYGADIAICDRIPGGLKDTAAAIKAAGRRVFAEEMDVRDEDRVAQFLGNARTALGPLSILVNNAGGGFWAPFLEVRAKGQLALIAENFGTVTNVVRHGVPLMHDGGSIVNITSVEAFHAAPGFGVYAAMKAAVENLTRTLALELSDRRIRINCVAPDAIPTPGDEDLAGRVAIGGADGYELHAKKVPLGLGTPDDCADVVVFLASTLSRFVTGATIPADGGSAAAGGWERGPDGIWLP